MVSLGAEGAEVGAWAGEQVLSSPHALPGRRAAAAGQEQLSSCCFGLHFSTAHALAQPAAHEEFAAPPALLRCLKAGAWSSVLLKHLSVLSALRWRGRQALLRGVYSQGLAKPATGNLHDRNSGSPCSPSLQQQIPISGSTGSPGDLGPFLSEPAKVPGKGKFKPAVQQPTDCFWSLSDWSFFFF